MMKIYLVRHGETPWNTQRRLQGQSDTSLNEFGCLLATKTGKGLEDVVFHRVYSSPLNRAYHTAELIMAENLQGRELPIVTDERIKEIGFGVYEGLCCSKEGWNIPDDSFHNYFDNCEAYQCPEGGENFPQVMSRIQEFFEMLCADESLKNENVLIVSHGALIRGMINYITGNPISNYWKGGVHKNCGVTMISYDGIELQIEVEDQVYYDDEVVDW